MGEQEIQVEWVLEAPRERVFAAYVDPELIREWWGPQETTTIVDELDARAGGRWRFVVCDPDGGEAGFRGLFREVAAPERISWTFEWEGLPGRISVETVTFDDLGERTRVVSISSFPNREERDGMLEVGVEKAIGETFVRLERLLGR